MQQNRVDKEAFIKLAEEILSDASKKIQPVREIIAKGEINLKEKYFVKSNFSYMLIYNTNFSNSWLQKSSFSHAVLEKVKFIGTDLSEADFTDATFKDIDFTDAKLSKTKFNFITINGEFNIWKAENPKDIEANYEGFQEIIRYLRMRAQNEADESEKEQIEELCKYYESMASGHQNGSTSGR